MKYSQSATTKRILKWWKLANDRQRKEGKKWYQTANDICRDISERYGVPLEKVCGVMSALSANTSWEQNIQLAEHFFKTGKVKHTVDNKKKVLKIMAGEDIPTVLNGEKTVNFFQNMYQPEKTGPVTVDRHAYDVAGIPSSYTRLRYDVSKKGYTNAGRILGVAPHVVQAVTWVAYREAKRNIA